MTWCITYDLPDDPIRFGEIRQSDYDAYFERNPPTQKEMKQHDDNPSIMGPNSTLRFRIVLWKMIRKEGDPGGNLLRSLEKTEEYAAQVEK